MSIIPQTFIFSNAAAVTFVFSNFSHLLVLLPPSHITLIRYSDYTHITQTNFSLLVHFAPFTFALHSHSFPISVLLSTRCHHLIDLSKNYRTLSSSSLFYLIFILETMIFYYSKPFHIYL